MNIAVNARHMNVTNAMREHIESKLDKLPRIYDGIQTIEAILDMEADKAVAEIVVTASRKHTFVATHRDEDMYTSIDQCLDKITQQIRRHKDRIRNHRVTPPSQMAIEPPDDSEE